MRGNNTTTEKQIIKHRKGKQVAKMFLMILERFTLGQVLAHNL